MTIHDATDLEELARRPGGVTVTSAAQALFDVEKPTDAQREKARRKLNKLHGGGKITAGNVGGATVYTASTGLTVVEPRVHPPHDPVTCTFLENVTLRDPPRDPESVRVSQARM